MNLNHFTNKIKNYSIVLFYRASAEEAIQKLHGSMIGQQIVRLSWGRSPASKQVNHVVIATDLRSLFVEDKCDLTFFFFFKSCHLSWS